MSFPFRLRKALTVFGCCAAITSITVAAPQPANAAAEAGIGDIVGMAHEPNSPGYWVVRDDGAVSNNDETQLPVSGDYGRDLNEPVVGMAPTPSTLGYWLTASDGGVFSYGDASFYGSMGGKHLNMPIVGMTATASGKGYWFVASDGGIFAYGDAGFYGSMGGKPLNKPIVGMTATPSGHGYWLVASDGGIFSYGDAAFYGSTGSIKLNKPIVGMSTTASGRGYWFVASDGGIFAYGDALFHGSLGASPPARPVVGMAASGSGNGYWFVDQAGNVYAFGDAAYEGGAKYQQDSNFRAPDFTYGFISCTASGHQKWDVKVGADFTGGQNWSAPSSGIATATGGGRFVYDLVFTAPEGDTLSADVDKLYLDSRTAFSWTSNIRIILNPDINVIQGTNCPAAP